MAIAVFHRQTILMPRAQWDLRQSVRATMKVIDGGVLVLRPIAVTLAILAAAAHYAGPTRDGAAGSAFTAVVIGDDVGSPARWLP
jgi:hypothetical protein